MRECAGVGVNTKREAQPVSKMSLGVIYPKCLQYHSVGTTQRCTPMWTCCPQEQAEIKQFLVFSTLLIFYHSQEIS
jgi:hypothetical protein